MCLSFFSVSCGNFVGVLILSVTSVLSSDAAEFVSFAHKTSPRILFLSLFYDGVLERVALVFFVFLSSVAIFVCFRQLPILRSLFSFAFPPKLLSFVSLFQYLGGTPFLFLCFDVEIWWRSLSTLSLPF